MSGNESVTVLDSQRHPKVTLNVSISPWVADVLNKKEYMVLEFLLIGFNVKTISDIERGNIKTISSRKMSIYRKLSIISDTTLYRDLLEQNAIVLSKLDI
ncbi:LuxR C-terminal-related transcriptional regulator [Citrobacter sp. Ce006]|uniref:LuxR C-terminal-related transcriptional regulator n=1 Tax=Citrobacter TaxID=544 RepID=UPI000CF70CF4|nr:LuxR C-terminal-related transcriptional regulator [Citrobacter sp. Ce006]AVH83716.1 hypothetical protein A6J81_25255 [Citrobacter braakii]MDM3321519.1 LuxR C-terminal-related transcriptional regulator [Citrobacter sp. Ce006]NRF59100.1 hypothetical protein [Citrobacter braakii]